VFALCLATRVARWVRESDERLGLDELIAWPARYPVPVRELVWRSGGRPSLFAPSLELVLGWFRLQSVRD